LLHHNPGRPVTCNAAQPLLLLLLLLGMKVEVLLLLLLLLLLLQLQLCHKGLRSQAPTQWVGIHMAATLGALQLLQQCTSSLLQCTAVKTRHPPAADCRSEHLKRRRGCGWGSFVLAELKALLVVVWRRCW
jgi:hypothetical protein